MSEWEEVRLEDITSVLGDGLHGTPQYDEDGDYFFINGNNLRNGRIVVDEKTRRSSYSEYLKHKKDLNNRTILVSINGTLGNVAFYFGEKVFLGKSACYFNLIDGVDKQFVRYVITSRYFQDYIETFATGTTIKNVSLRSMRSFAFRLPPAKEQQRISSVLSVFDDRIELNQQISQTLEQIAQAIFKSWFVDFEPVKAKQHVRALGANDEQTERAAQAVIAGAVNLDVIITATDLSALHQKLVEALSEKLAHQTNAQREQLASTASHFPDQLVESELGMIPEGWKVSSVGREFHLVIGQSPPGDTYNENCNGMPFFQGRRDFGWRYPANRVYCTDPKRLASKGDTLLSVRAPVGDVNKATSDCCIGRGIAALRHKSGCEAITYYSALNLSRLFESFDSEGTVFGSINQKNLKALGIVVASRAVIEIFSSVAGAVDLQIENIEEQVRTLSLSRDALLPKLLSGELAAGKAA